MAFLPLPPACACFVDLSGGGAGGLLEPLVEWAGFWWEDAVPLTAFVATEALPDLEDELLVFTVEDVLLRLPEDPVLG